MRASDKAIEFIVDSNKYGVDTILYFPSGLDWDKSARGVWDYKMKYSKCPAEIKKAFIYPSQTPNFEIPLIALKPREKMGGIIMHTDNSQGPDKGRFFKNGESTDGYFLSMFRPRV